MWDKTVSLNEYIFCVSNLSGSFVLRLLACIPANVISCVATVASNAPAKDVTTAKKLAKATCQEMVEFSSFIETVDVQVSKAGRAGSKTTLAVTFDRTLTGN